MMIEEIDKLRKLKEIGAITEEEFDRLILKSDTENTSLEVETKSRGVYIIIAVLFGLLGIHNFYIGRFKRGLLQLLSTILLSVLFTSAIMWIWILIDVFTVKTDGLGKELSRAGKWVYVFVGLIIAGFLSIIIIGGMAGYNMAMSRYKANEISDAVKKYSVLSLKKCEQLIKTGQISGKEQCSNRFISTYQDAGLGRLPVGVKSIDFVRIEHVQQQGKNAVLTYVELEDKNLCKAVYEVSARYSLKASPCNKKNQMSLMLFER